MNIRVLHCISQLPGATGSGTYLQALIREGRAAGLRQWLLCGQPAATPLPDLPGLERERLFTVRFETAALPFPIPGMSDVMPYPSSRFAAFDRQRRHQYEAAFARELQRAVAAARPHLIHSHHLWLLTALIKRLYPEIPLVASCHGTDLRQLHLAGHLALPVIAGCQEIDLVLALNEQQRREISEFYALDPGKILVTGSGFRADLFCPADRRPPPSPVILLYAGKLSRAKGVPWLLEAVASLDGICLWLAGSGSGEEASEIRRQARRLGGRVRLLGQLSQAELAAAAARAHIFVLPSFYEGVPLVLLETLACGCRAVVTDLPGIRELLPPEARETGLVTLVSPPRLQGPDIPLAADLPGFVDRLRQAIAVQAAAVRRDPHCSCGQLVELLQRQSWPQVARRIFQAYRELTGVPNPAP
ncbi:MAG: glycosyltransferase family 4 protein [Deltaproteobacteria bacterium]|nr:glycosyltransferase family 4 protein [Deltaproteobacteria bacterium]